MNPAPTRSENLAIMFQEVLTSIVRLQRDPAQAPAAADVTRRVKALLDKARIEACKRYQAPEVEKAESAVTAMLDEVGFSTEHQRRPSGFGQWIAVYPSRFPHLPNANIPGENFFLDIDSMLATGATPHTSDVLEVYLTCILLGFEGVFGVPNHPGVQKLRFRSLDEYRRQLLPVVRGVASPSMVVDAGPDVPTAPRIRARGRPVTLVLLIAVLLVPVLVWAVFRLLLSDDLSHVLALIWGLG